jgi:hypothetical protein
MTVVSMCHISSARVVRSPILGFAGCRRSRGRRQPFCRTRRYQVEGEAQTAPSRWADRERAAAPQLQDLLSELRLSEVRNIRQTTTVGAAPSHPRAVERGTPRPSRRSRPRCVGRDAEAGGRSAAAGAAVGINMIIGRSLAPLNSSRTMGSVRRHDDNSRGKVQNVRGDSSAAHYSKNEPFRSVPISAKVLDEVPSGADTNV